MGAVNGRTKRPGPSLVLALLVMALGVVVVVPSIVEGVLPWVRTFSSAPSRVAPGVARVHLSPGNYRIFERTGNRARAGGVTFGREASVTIEPQDVQVTGTDGARVGVTFPGNTETITRRSRVYTAAVAFHISDGGDYDVAVTPPAPTEIIISRSLGDTFRQSVPWIGAAVAGGFVVVVGIVLLIVGMVRRSRANRAVFVPSMAGMPGYPAATMPYATWPPRPQPEAEPPRPAAPQPGWYTDPAGSGGLRFWDGNGWTEHVR